MSVQAVRPLRVGDVLADAGGAGHFGGLFGPGFYFRTVRVEAIGADWVVFRDDRGRPLFADVDPESMTPWRESRGGAFPEDV